jgi:hypothetical protein
MSKIWMVMCRGTPRFAVASEPVHSYDLANRVARNKAIEQPDKEFIVVESKKGYKVAKPYEISYE